MTRLSKKTRKALQTKGLERLLEDAHDVAVMETIAPSLISFVKNTDMVPIILKDPFYNETLNYMLSALFNKLKNLKDNKQCK